MSEIANDRWQGVERPYSQSESAPARLGAHRIQSRAPGAGEIWRQLHTEPVVTGLDR